MKAYLLFGINFKQHIPSVAHGSQALGDSRAKVVNDNPSAAWKPKRVVGDGDLVVVHGHRRFSPDDRGAAVVNILRIVIARSSSNGRWADPSLKRPPTRTQCFDQSSVDSSSELDSWIRSTLMAAKKRPVVTAPKDT
jgi:predicted SnoaL-like aldol condensation-catalyzing enzyme